MSAAVGHVRCSWTGSCHHTWAMKHIHQPHAPRIQGHGSCWRCQDAFLSTCKCCYLLAAMYQSILGEVLLLWNMLDNRSGHFCWPHHNAGACRLHDCPAIVIRDVIPMCLLGRSWLFQHSTLASQPKMLSGIWGRAAADVYDISKETSAAPTTACNGIDQTSTHLWRSVAY